MNKMHQQQSQAGVCGPDLLHMSKVVAVASFQRVFFFFFGCFGCFLLEPHPSLTRLSLQQPSEEGESPDPKSVGLGKKMKAISLTMRRKMGKKHAKSFSEETVSRRAA